MTSETCDTNTLKTPQHPSAYPQALAQSDYPPAEAVLPLDAPHSSAPTWLNLLLGQFILRACPSGAKVDSCKGCQLRPLCRCAHGHLRNATTIEARFWLVLALAIGLGLYSLLRAMLNR